MADPEEGPGWTWRQHRTVRHRLRERGTRRELEEAAAEEEVNDLTIEEEYELWLKLQERKKKVAATAGRRDPWCDSLEENNFCGKKDPAG
jgi:hypothetical protein